MPIEGEVLAEEIRNAFADVVKPSPAAITPCDCEECTDIRVTFDKLEGRVTPSEILEQNYCSLPLLSPEALHFFFPSYLEYSLRNPDSLVYEFTLYHLAPDRNDVKSDYWKERIGRFTPLQRRAICCFLEWAESIDGDDRYGFEIERGKEAWCPTA